jgi:hypothetical protein
MDKRLARKQVAALLKRFFAHLTSSDADGSAELWRKAELRLAHKQPASKPEPARESGIPAGVLRTPMQRQPMQQQQARTKGGDDTK